MGTENLQDKIFFVVDAINGNKARCENLENKEIVVETLGKLPLDIKEGDVISCSKGHYLFEREKTEERKKEISRLFDSLWE